MVRSPFNSVVNPSSPYARLLIAHLIPLACLLLLARPLSPAAAAPTTQTYCTPPLCLAWSSTESDYIASVAWGDYDGDGDLDLAVGNKDYHDNQYPRQNSKRGLDLLYTVAL